MKPKKRLNFYDLAGVMCYTAEGRVLVPPVASAWGDIDVGINFTICGGEKLKWNPTILFIGYEVHD